MSEFAGHTPGPLYSIGPRVYAGDSSTCDEPLNIADCDMDTRIDYDTTAVANAALFAAAPTLLAQRDALADALRKIASCEKRLDGDVVDIARTALALLEEGK